MIKLFPYLISLISYGPLSVPSSGQGSFIINAIPAAFTPRYRKTILSVNENEGRLIYKALFLKNPVHMEEMAERIGRALKIDYFILHLCDSSYGYQNGRLEFETGYYTAVPRISTGGGDNFNGGLCFGLLHGFSLKESLKLGNAGSGYYVRYGKSPNLSRLAAFLQEEPGRVKEEKVLRTESTGE